MIIYDNNKQFIAIDEEDLKSLGYSSLEAMLSEAADFADLFIKTPGHVHNFKNVHWIDFVLCATDKNSSKAIIHANGKNFSCILDIRTTYLTTSPSQISYNVHLNNLRLLTAEELQSISNELQTRVAPVSASQTQLEQATVSTSIPESVEIVQAEPTTKKTEEVENITEKETVIQDPYELDEDEFSLDVYDQSQEDLDKVGDAETEPKQMTRDDLHDNLHEHILHEDEDEDEALEISFDDEDGYLSEKDETSKIENTDANEDEYVFNIQDTADALEMDVATIEDFVNDFIMQSKEFKPKLYEAVDNDDMIELKSLSHQLKGVAANLRIHDAQEILVKINKAENFTESVVDLDKFYTIIAKLAGEELEEKKTEAVVVEDSSVEVPEEIGEALQILDELEEAPQDTLEIPDEDALEIPDIAEIEEDTFEIADEIEETPDEDALEIPDIAEIEEDTFEIADEIEETPDEDALEISQIDDFDLLDEEQDSLIKTEELTEIKSEDMDSGFLKIYDKKHVAQEIGLDEESFNELFEDYSIESQALIKEARDAIEADEPNKWQHAAVKLKGMSDNMRIDAFQTDVEVLISTQNNDDAKNIINRIEDVLIQILETKD